MAVSVGGALVCVSGETAGCVESGIDILDVPQEESKRTRRKKEKLRMVFCIGVF